MGAGWLCATRGVCGECVVCDWWAVRCVVCGWCAVRGVCD